MTGFARADGEYEGRAITWELRSVNGRSIDLRLRLPAGMERIEQKARTAIQRCFARGNFSGALNLGPSETDTVPTVNEAALSTLLQVALRLQRDHGCAPPSADGLLGLRGVLETPGYSDSDLYSEGLEAAAMNCLEDALDRLAASRRQEGASLAAILSGKIDRIEELVHVAEADPSRTPAAIRERLRLQLQPLIDSSLDPQRLYQEAAVLATRADVGEEIDRLKAHVAAARGLLADGKVVGRKLDFLAQEFNRESNTLCAKSNSASLTAIGLELKVVVDQLREQVQNLE